MWETLKEITAGVYAILTCGWLLAHLVMILMWGQVMIMENNQWILWVEIAGTTGLLGLLVERLVNDAKKEGN